MQRIERNTQANVRFAENYLIGKALVGEKTMCPRTRSILVATAMLVFSLLAAALIANMARSGDSVREKAAMRNSQVSFFRKNGAERIG